MPAGPQALSRGFRGVIKPAAAPQLHVALPILFDRRQSTRRPLVVISLRDVAAQLQHPPRQLADTGCVFGKAEFTAKFLSIAPPNRHRGQSGSSLCIVGDLDRRRSDRHLQFRCRSVARARKRSRFWSRAPFHEPSAYIRISSKNPWPRKWGDFRVWRSAISRSKIRRTVGLWCWKIRLRRRVWSSPRGSSKRHPPQTSPRCHPDRH